MATIPNLERAASALVGFCLAVASTVPALSADVTVRELSETLYRSAPGQPADLEGKDLGELDLSGLDFKSARLARANLYGADLTDASLAGANLTGVRLDRATITRAEFSSANLERATLLRPSLYTDLVPDAREAPRFRGTRMVEARLFGRFDFVDFRWSDLTAASFVGTDGRDENLSLGRGSFRSANFSESVMKNARLGGSNFAYAKFVGADLRGADLRNTVLIRADFTGADLTDADVTGADLDEAVVTGAKGLDRLKGLSSALNADRVVR